MGVHEVPPLLPCVTATVPAVVQRGSLRVPREGWPFSRGPWGGSISTLESVQPLKGRAHFRTLSCPHHVGPPAAPGPPASRVGGRCLQAPREPLAIQEQVRVGEGGPGFRK